MWEFDALGHKGRRREGTHGVERVSEIKPCEHHVCPRGTSKRLVLPIHMVTREHFTWHSGSGVGGCTCTHISSSLTETLRLAHYCLIVYQELRRQLGKWEEEVKSPQRKAPACDARALTESHCSHVPPGSHLRLVLPRLHAHSSLVSTPSQCSQHRFARSFRAHTESGMHLLLARCRVLLTADYLGTKLWREMYGCL